MAPKKKGGGKKGGGKGKKEEGGEGSADMGPAELLKRAAWRIESLERQLVWREEKVSQATAAQKELRDRVLQYHADFAKEKEEVFDVAADRERLYAACDDGSVRVYDHGRAAASTAAASGSTTFDAQQRHALSLALQTARSRSRN